MTVTRRWKQKRLYLGKPARIAELRWLSFERKPEICIERARYITKFCNPTCIKLFDSLVFFIAGKAGSIFHCVPTYTPMLERGLLGLIEDAAACEAKASQAGSDISPDQVNFNQAIQITLKGIIA